MTKARRIRFTKKGDRGKQEDRAYDEHGDAANPCCICGRHTDGTRWVVLGNGGGSIIHPQDEWLETSDPGYMGIFEIGPACQRNQKIPAEYVTVDGQGVTQ